MPKSFKNLVVLFLKRMQLRRKGVKFYNNTTFSGVKFKGKATIEPYCRLVGDPLIELGDNFYLNAGGHFLGEITIGDDVQIGPKVVIWGRDHGIEKGTKICDQPHNKLPVKIGNDVWIGANVTILKGVNIGDGAVIGAGAVVIKDIPENGIAVGNPARVVKKRS